MPFKPRFMAVLFCHSPPIDYLCIPNQYHVILDTDPLPASDPGFLLLSLLADAMAFTPPASWTEWAFIVAIAFCCLLVSAFISGSEMAYFGLTPAQIDDLREAEDSRSRTAFFLVSHSERLLATILIVNNLVNITMVVLLSTALNQVVRFNSPVLDFLFQTVLLTFLLLLFGEIFPKLVARGRTLSWVLFAGSPLTFFYKAFGPVARVMVKGTNLVTHAISRKRDNISTDELEKALEISDIKEGQEKEMLEGILQFGEKEVCDIMISRVDVTDIEYHATWTEAMNVIIKSGFSRIPVYDTSQDSIRGILYSKDLLPYVGKEDDSFQWQSLLRDAYFVPESRMIDDLLEDFRKKKIHIAIVIDEYGGTRGIVTLEDIIEEIVGEIDDEYDTASTVCRRISPDTYIFDAKIPLGDFCHCTGIEEEQLGDIGDAETLAGLLLEIKGDFPAPKEKLQRGPCRFEVLNVDRHRITRVKVKVVPDITEKENTHDNG